MAAPATGHKVAFRRARTFVLRPAATINGMLGLFAESGAIAATTRSSEPQAFRVGSRIHASDL